MIKRNGFKSDLDYIFYKQTNGLIDPFQTIIVIIRDGWYL